MFEAEKDKYLMKHGFGATRLKAYQNHLYNDEGEIIGENRFSMKGHESSGTNKLFDLAALVIGQLDFGYPLIVDELDSKLHPLLTQHIIKD